MALALEAGLNRSAGPPPVDELFARIRGEYTGADMAAGKGPNGLVKERIELMDIES